MLLYNVTLILDDAAAEEWLQWAQDIHIPVVMATGLFVSHRLLKVLDSPNEGITYCVQYVAESQEQYNQYLNIHAPALQEDLNTKFKNRFVAYRTLMEFVG
ncbi:DUF4286 family protein [Pedobacter punctiformis]|uniref:DUF4286 family protein n=1 Tax=Pedobacter punctiformis TaxID=3004097 RepID=A0ABT4L4B4_9SPHI|nr:DUF4286 family protein [Pedobacter sp. HCMS5-2]MCZ4242768.1 DUF4286 family protein [Pedobacter sp. HCMS5-2]